MRYNARNQLWEGFELKGVKGWFNDLRIDRDSVPKGFNFYELADGDSNGTPCRYALGILVNFYGTFITTGELELKDGYGFNNEDEYAFLSDTGMVKFSELLEIEGVNDRLFSTISSNKGGTEND